MTTAPPPPPGSAAGRAASAIPAPVIKRVLAGLIDLVGGIWLWLAILGILRLVGFATPVAAVAVALLLAVPRELILARTGSSVGGLLTGVRLVNPDNGEPPMTRLLLHADLLFITLVPTLGLGAIPLMRAASRDAYGQGWHDRLAGIQAIIPRRRGGRITEAEWASARHSGAAEQGRGGEDYFPDSRYSFTPDNDSPNVAHTFDAGSVLDSRHSGQQAIIDSVPWSAVPTQLDSPTADTPMATVTSPSPWQTGPIISPAPAHTEPVTTRASHRPEPVTTRAARHQNPASEPVITRTPLRERRETRETRETPSPDGPAARRETPSPEPVGTRASRRETSLLESPGADREAPVAMPESPPAQVSSAATVPVPVSARRSARPASASADQPLVRVTRMSARRAAARSEPIKLVPLIGGDSVPLSVPAVLGRDPENISEYPDATRVALADATRSISKTHAAVAPVPGGVWVTDLHSTNGTCIERTDHIEAAVPGVPAPAPAGSVIIFGRAAYRVED